MAYLIWEERYLYPTVRRFWLESLNELEQQWEYKPFAYFELSTDIRIRWYVSINNVIRAGYVDTIFEAQEKILKDLFERGIDLRNLPSYFISQLKGAMEDPRKRLVQRIDPSEPLPVETLLMSYTKDQVLFLHTENCTITTIKREQGEEGFNPYKYLKSYLERKKD